MRVFFHLEPDVPYDDSISYLAEGLSDLGVECYAARDYWWDEKKASPLVKKANLQDEMWPIVFVTYLAYRYDYIDYRDSSGKVHSRIQIPDLDLLRKHAKALVHVDLEDGYNDRGGDDPRIDLVFRAKFNRHCKQSAKSRPYILGVQKRILRITPRSSADRTNGSKVLDSFGFSHHFSHGSRLMFRNRITPLLEASGIFVVRQNAGSMTAAPQGTEEKRWWVMSRYLHNPAYYELIKEYPVHACFCGEMIPALPHDPTPILRFGNKARLKKTVYKLLSNTLGRPERSIQWDSWRFWETLALGSVPLMYDLEKMGVVLPVMPQNWVHYVGIDPRDEARSVKELRHRWDELPQIAQAGRQWLLENYSPEANAKRVLREIEASR